MEIIAYSGKAKVSNGIKYLVNKKLIAKRIIKPSNASLNIKIAETEIVKSIIRRNKICLYRPMKSKIQRPNSVVAPKGDFTYEDSISLLRMLNEYLKL